VLYGSARPYNTLLGAFNSRVCLMNKIWKLMRNMIYPGLLFALLFAVIFEAPTTEHSAWPSPLFYLALFLVIYHCVLYVESEDTYQKLGRYTPESLLRDIFDILILGAAFSSLEFLIPSWLNTNAFLGTLCVCFILPVAFRSNRKHYAWILDILSLSSLVAVIAAFSVLSLMRLSIIVWFLFGFYLIFVVIRHKRLTKRLRKDALPRAS